MQVKEFWDLNWNKVIKKKKVKHYETVEEI